MQRKQGGRQLSRRIEMNPTKSPPSTCCSSAFSAGEVVFFWRRGTKTQRIVQGSRLVFHVHVFVDTAVEPDWVFAQESALCRVVVPGSVIVKSGFRVEFARSVAE